MQLARKRYYKHVLLLHVALRLGLLPDRPRLDRLRILHLSASSLQPPRVWHLRLHHNVCTLLVHSRSSTHDVSLYFLFLNLHFSNTPSTVFVKARDRFRDAGLSANIGRYAFGFTWGAWAAMFLATIFLFMGCGAGGRRSDDHVRGSGTRGGSTRFFRRQRSRRSARGSFVDTESQRRVKDEYA
jgi:hypothetical protein